MCLDAVSPQQVLFSSPSPAAQVHSEAVCKAPSTSQARAECWAAGILIRVGEKSTRWELGTTHHPHLWHTPQSRGVPKHH